MIKWYFFALNIAFFAPLFCFAQESMPVEMIQLNDLGEEQWSIFPFGEDYRGFASLTTADLGMDGIEEIILGSGPGLEPLVKVYRQDGSMIHDFLAYDPSYKNGIEVTTCDLDNDGVQEIITGTMQGGGPHIRIFNSMGHAITPGFFAYDVMFRGGVYTACGDLNGDGQNEIITGAGVGGGPHIRIFDLYGNLNAQFFLETSAENSGAKVAAGDINGDGRDELITSQASAGDTQITLFNFNEGQFYKMNSFTAADDYQNTISLSTKNNFNGEDKIYISSLKDNEGWVKSFNQNGELQNSVKPFLSANQKGILGSFINDNSFIFLSLSAKESDEIGKSIVVDINTQTLYAYENGIPVFNFLISSGLPQYPTPTGTFSITDKLETYRYRWSYGPNNPNNYDLDNVKWNLRFLPHYYIHSAYWHNNFGHRMSHGCVNVETENAKKIFDWAEVGTVVHVVEK